MKAEHFSSDILAFIKLLHQHSVRYLIVGGEAVIYYGYPRLTGDVDFFYKNDVGNINNLFDALLTFWDGDIPGITYQKELMEDGNIIQFGVPPNRIDLMNTIDGVNFKDAWKEKETVHIPIRKKNIPIYFLGLDDLIINKAQSGRNKDLDDLAYLKTIQEKRAQN